MNIEPLTIVAAVNNRRILQSNLLRSPALATISQYEFLIKENFSSASLAYNAAIDEAKNDLMIFFHQDIYLPVDWFQNVMRCIEFLERAGAPWGVLGSFGVKSSAAKGIGRIYSTGWGLLGDGITRPEPVETLDEIVLIIRKSSGLRFDPKLPHFHMYGVDLCLSARSKGLNSYVVPAFCVHNTNQLLVLPAEFNQCYAYVKRKWPQYLPVQTSCTRITRFDWDLTKRRVENFVSKVLGKQRIAANRAADPLSLMTDDQINRESNANGFVHP